MAEIDIYKKSSRLFGSSEKVGTISVSSDGLTWVVYKLSPTGFFSSKTELGKIHDSTEDDQSRRRKITAYIKTDKVFFPYKEIDASKLTNYYDFASDFLSSSGYAFEGSVQNAREYKYTAYKFDMDVYDSILFSYAFSLLISK